MSDHDQVKMTPMNYDVNRPKADNPLKVMDLSLRDGHQSLFATRGRTAVSYTHLTLPTN